MQENIQNTDVKMNDVTVFVKSVQENSDQVSDGIEFFAAGSYYLKNGVKYIRYTEQGEGMEQINTTVKVEGDERVTVMRHGPQQYRLVLSKGERQHSLYKTEFGEILLGVSGTKIKSELNEEGGTLHLEYLLDVNNAVISRNTLDISVNGLTGN